MTLPILNIDALDFPQARIGFAGRQLGAKKLGYGKPRELRFMGRAGESLEYWQGE